METVANKKSLDLNIDLTQELLESPLKSVLDEVSSVNIPCDDPIFMMEALKACEYKNIALGALLKIDEEKEIEPQVIYQVGALSSFVEAFGFQIEHVRTLDSTFNAKIADAVKKINKWLIYYVPASEAVKELEQESEIRVVQEIRLGKNTEESLKRVKNIIDTTENPIESIHFDMNMSNLQELLTEISKFVQKQPSNYNKVESSGWV